MSARASLILDLKVRILFVLVHRIAHSITFFCLRRKRIGV
jgi:hypothetical protein